MGINLVILTSLQTSLQTSLGTRDAGREALYATRGYYMYLPFGKRLKKAKMTKWNLFYYIASSESGQDESNAAV